MSSIKQKWDAIDANEAALESSKWALARELAESGKKHRQLAEETGRHHSTVGRWIAVHREFGAVHGAHFNESLNAVKGVTSESENERIDVSKAKKVLRTSPEVIAEMVEELHDDPAFQAAVASANSQIDAKRERRIEERERVEHGLSNEDVEFERLRKDFRTGNFGEAERRLERMDVDTEVAAYLRKQAERLRQLAEWAEAWAGGAPITDEAIAEWLAA